MYPLKFEPYLRTMVWGGEKIAPYKGVQTDQEKIGESWEISAVKGHVSVVANGPLAGRTLTEVMEQSGEELAGKKVIAATGTEFPLLIKFIDAKSDLSIQVHPDDELAEKTHPGMGMKGKTEMWYVVGADKDAHLLSGLTKEITPDEYEDRVKNNTITEVLANHAIAPGDVFFLPAGRIHAIGAGSFVAEIQQTSDITYRIYDYGRLGLDGKPRELHIEQAKEATDYRVFPEYKTEYVPQKNAEVDLASCKYFTTSLLDVDREYSKPLADLDSFLVVICVKGAGTLVDTEADGSVHEVPVRTGETVLVPASSQSIVFRPEQDGMTCLLSCVQ